MKDYEELKSLEENSELLKNDLEDLKLDFENIGYTQVEACNAAANILKED